MTMSFDDGIDSIDGRYIALAAHNWHLHNTRPTDLQAKIIANAWHGGQSSPLYSFTSTGAIGEGIEREIADCIGHSKLEDGMSVPERSLRALLDYVQHAGERGPQPNWERLTW